MMEWVPVVVFAAGFVFGIGAAFLFRLVQARTARELASELFRETEAQRQAQMASVIDNIKASFGNLSLEALSRSTEEFLKLAKEKLESEREIGVKELDAKKGLIDQQLKQMTVELDQVSKLIKAFEQERAEKFGQLANQLRTASEQTAALVQTTTLLREALASTKIRGQWGERMAEDVLRLAGFIENVNYLKQKSIEGTSSRPDFTFLLPRDLRLNMDVKFPLDNYLRFLEAQSEADKMKYRNDFLRDVKARIREVTTRDYINPEQNTVDYVLLFIPNEQIYAFIHEQDGSILDEGIRNRVVFCSPVTLFAVLAVIRQAVENFALQQTSNEMLSLLGAFRKQWQEFLGRMERLGEKIDQTRKEYDGLVSTRRRQLERPLNRLEELRMQRGIAVAQEEGPDTLGGPEERS